MVTDKPPFGRGGLSTVGNPSSPVCMCAAGPIIRAGQLWRRTQMPLRADCLFIKGKHLSPEVRAKISAGLRRHWLQRSARIAAEEARAERNLEAVRKQLAVLRAKGFK